MLWVEVINQIEQLSRFHQVFLLRAGVLWVYNSRGWGNLNEIVRIPLIEYLAVVVLALLIGGGLWITRRITALVERSKSRRDMQSYSAGD